MVYARFAFLMTAFALSGGALALDIDDIVLLKRNGVSDTVIINMVQNQGLPRPLTAQDIVQLSANGLSSDLLEYLTRPGTVTEQQPVVIAPPVLPPPAVTFAPPITYYSSPGYTYGQRYYYGPPRRSGLIFDFSFGGRHHRGGTRPRHHDDPHRHGPRRR
jgi:hypothetical protein